ncbi:hypothetical protein O9Z70_08110 [Devosia sp. YIM 151766]|uniref:hypothetical protein n=1 Tax=Devosia sp. YIM 151766 TaxID=3017325 RepID=UPI00255C2E33|nr:hypothetical protein [Devosia sp. YIM 151766]WIY51459.1 hypothetical protein O9Z70_08110 [Devosia sp. YIM 151766]
MTANANLKSGFTRLHGLASARGLRGLTQSTSDGAPALAVADNVFVHMLDADIAVLQCPVDQKVLLMEISPGIYFETEPYIGKDAMLIRLDRIDDEELSLRLHDAWEFKAPDRLKQGRD